MAITKTAGGQANFLFRQKVYCYVATYFCRNYFNALLYVVPNRDRGLERPNPAGKQGQEKKETNERVKSKRIAIFVK
jgi:hypothetical protein